MTPLKSEQATPVPERDIAMARRSRRAITRLLKGEDVLNVTFTNAAGERLDTTLPAEAVRMLERILDEIAEGRSVALDVGQTELTTHQAAAMLRVSRPFLIKLLDAGAIPHRKVGSHRRIRHDDLKAYLERENAARRDTLRELAAYDQEIGLYDVEAS